MTINQLTDEHLVAHIKMLDGKARAAQSELAHARRLLKKRKKALQRLTGIGQEITLALEARQGFPVD